MIKIALEENSYYNVWRLTMHRGAKDEIFTFS